MTRYYASGFRLSSLADYPLFTRQQVSKGKD